MVLNGSGTFKRWYQVEGGEPGWPLWNKLMLILLWSGLVPQKAVSHGRVNLTHSFLLCHVHASFTSTTHTCSHRHHYACCHVMSQSQDLHHSVWPLQPSGSWVKHTSFLRVLPNITQSGLSQDQVSTKMCSLTTAMTKGKHRQWRRDRCTCKHEGAHCRQQ